VDPEDGGGCWAILLSSGLWASDIGATIEAILVPHWGHTMCSEVPGSSRTMPQPGQRASTAGRCMPEVIKVSTYHVLIHIHTHIHTHIHPPPSIGTY